MSVYSGVPLFLNDRRLFVKKKKIEAKTLPVWGGQFLKAGFHVSEHACEIGWSVIHLYHEAVIKNKNKMRGLFCFTRSCTCDWHPWAFWDGSWPRNIHGPSRSSDALWKYTLHSHSNVVLVIKSTIAIKVQVGPTKNKKYTVIIIPPLCRGGQICWLRLGFYDRVCFENFLRIHIFESIWYFHVFENIRLEAGMLYKLWSWAKKANITSIYSEFKSHIHLSCHIKS